MARGFGDLLAALQSVLPPWALGLIGVVVLLAALPGFRYRTRSRQLREAIRRMIRADPSQRTALTERAFGRAGTDVKLLVELAREARKRSLPAVYQRAIAALREQPKGRAEAAILEREVARAKVDPIHPVEAAVRVEQLLEAQAYEGARVRLAEALAQHPEDAGLIALRGRLDTATQPASPALDVPTPER